MRFARLAPTGKFRIALARHLFDAWLASDCANAIALVVSADQHEGSAMQWSGLAVRPARQPWRVEGDVVVTIGAPMRVDAYERVPAAQAHAVARTRRILLMATLSNGTPVPEGLAVLDARRREIARVADGGAIVLANTAFVAPLGVRLPGGGIGLLHFALPPTCDATRHYERIPALCTPVHRTRAPR